MMPLHYMRSWHLRVQGRSAPAGRRPKRNQDSLAEWSKALASGASPQGRGFEPHSCHCPTRTRNAAGTLTGDLQGRAGLLRELNPGPLAP
jgi:hypothetical protein